MTTGRSSPRVLLDTGVCSYILNYHTKGEPFKASMEGMTRAVSFMTVGQMYFGAYRRRWGDRRMTHLGEYMQTFVCSPIRRRSR